MIFINELDELRLYKKPFHLPILEENKRKGSLLYLLTPNYESSKKLLQNQLIINKNYFLSYYIEKDITYYINQEGGLIDSALNIINKTINESILKTLQQDTTKVKAHNTERIKRKLGYEISKRKHKFNKENDKINNGLSNPVISNVKQVEPELSKPTNISPQLSQPKQSEPVLSESKHQLVNYIDRCDNIDYEKPIGVVPGINRAVIKDDDLISLSEAELYEIKQKDYYINEGFMRCNNTLFIFNENLDEDILNENTAYNKMLYKMLYKERLKTNKDVFKLYTQVKQDISWINRTYISLSKYKQRNLIVDLSFYNQTFFKNNIYKLDKAVNLYFDFIDRFIKDKRFDKYNYKLKTVFIPLEDWYNPDTGIYRYNKDINPISIIFRTFKSDPEKLKMWKGIDFVFITDKGYFKLDLSNLTKINIGKFKVLINKLLAKIEIEDNDNTESKKAIVSNIISKIENTQKIKIDNLTGNSKEVTKSEIDEKIKKAEIKSSNSVTKKEKNDKEKSIINKKSDNKKKIDEINKKEKEILVDKIKKAAEISNNTEEALDNLDKDEDIKKILQDVINTEDDTVKISATRAARINILQDEFLNKEIKNVSIKNMIEKSSNNEELPKTEINVDSINEDEWNNMKYINFEKVYNPTEDIMKIINSFATKTYPVAIKDIKIEDNSTSEDYVQTYSCQMEDGFGSRFTVKFDVPELVDSKFLMLRGNQKTINGQLMQIPIMKTEDNTVQIVSNYNKIFIRTFGSTTGKSYPIPDKIIKSLRKCTENKDIKIIYGNNNLVCSKYELPIDYIDLASIFNIIETENHIIYFNQDEIQNKYKINEAMGIPIAYDKKHKEILYYNGTNFTTCSNLILWCLRSNKEFADIYMKSKLSTRYSYSKASILNTTIPLIVIMGYYEGLIKAMDKSNIKYDLSEVKKSDNYIKFKDGYINFELDYNSSLLMNGLKECNTDEYSIKDINNKAMFLDFLEIFGTRILADGLDNFYDLMIDPITEETLKKYKLPTDFVTLLAYANCLLCDNKYTKHTDMNGRKYRSNEIIAGYVYKALSESYGNYQREIKRKGKGTMTIKQSAVLDKILLDPTASDVSVLNDLGLIESINTVSFKGLSGMNSDRSYSLDKRTFDDSMINILGLSTGFAGNVGITRQTTMDMNVESKRGYLKTDKSDNLSTTKTFTATELLTPFGVLRDDPFRSAMTFIQTAKHGMRIKKGMPSLISNGADQALPYITPNVFSYKSKDSGKITEKTNDYMIIKYDNGTSDFIDLRSTVRKNSNGGFYTSVKLDSDLKQGSKIKKNQIVAYDKLSYSDKIGDPSNIAYNLGALTKIAILNTDEGYEDSAIISEWLSDAMSSEVVTKKEVILSKNTNIYNMVKKGQPIQEGDPLLIFQNAFEEEDINILLKNLTNSEENISDLGRIPIKSNITGIVEDIKIYRTVEKDELSESLRKEINKYEKPISDLKKTMIKNDIKDANKLESDYKLDPIGKVKNAQDGILIEFYLKYEDKMSVGDKLIYYSALKGVTKDIFPKGKEPTSEFRPNEKLHSLLSKSSIDGRMVTSILVNMGINKILIELDRSVKDMLNIPWKYLDEI